MFITVDIPLLKCVLNPQDFHLTPILVFLYLKVCEIAAQLERIH